MTRDEALVVEDLVVAYARWGQRIVAVDDLSLEVPRGQWLMVVGPNGSGKSSLLRAIGRRVGVERGRITSNGRDLLALSQVEVSDTVYYVHQNPAFGTAGTLTVLENLLVAEPPTKASRRERTARLAALLAEVGLEDRLHQPASLLSGGERQLLTLVVARLRPSQVVLLDEPTSALDPARAALCLEAISGLSAEGKTLLHVTHDRGHATGLGDRTVLLKNGRIARDIEGPERSEAELRFHWTIEEAI